MGGVSIEPVEAGIRPVPLFVIEQVQFFDGGQIELGVVLQVVVQSTGAALLGSTDQERNPTAHR